MKMLGYITLYALKHHFYMYYRNVQQVGFQGGYVSQNATVIQAVGVISGLRKESVQVNCTNCQRTGFTRVESKIANHGWIWAIVCFFCGSWLLSLLIFCIDAFKEFLHYCPFCNSMIGVYKPQFAGGVIALLILLPIGFIIIQIVILVAVVLPMIYHANKQFDNFNNYGYN